MGYAEVKLLNGDVFVVEGTLDEVESKLSDAARSGQSRLAWFGSNGEAKANGEAKSESKPAAAALTDTPPVVPAKMGADLELGPACDQLRLASRQT